ncbi:MAG: S41 family peptidase [Gemmatimonadota bacterium]
MQLRGSIWKPAIIGLTAILSGGWLLQQATNRNVYIKMRLFQDLVRTISDRYVEPVEPTDLYDLAIEGLIEGLGDPHSTVLTPDEYSELRLQTTGNYGGLGIRIDDKDGWITVVATLPNTPAERAGLRAGDRIIEVDGQSSRGWKSDDAVRVLRGPKGSPVNIRVSRVGVDNPIPFRIVRGAIHVDYVTAFMLAPEIGYVRLQQFSESAADEIRELVAALSEEGMKSLILDLRGNPGGLLEEGVAVSDLFLDAESEVVETRSRIPEQNETYYASRKPMDPDLPVIVLVDGFAASASEIVAGALQDHDRALVVGTPTFGKGSVQTLFPLPGGNYLKLTTAKWYTPSGRSIHRESTAGELLALAPAEAGRASAGGGGVTGSEVTTVQEIYYTDSGREVYGGGGISPDVTVRSDTLTSVEREFRRALGDRVAAYNDALFRFVVEYVNEHPNLTPGFAVGPGILDQLYVRLLDSGIDVPRELYDGSERLIKREIGIQLALVAFDESAAMRRRLVLDAQVESAVELLSQGYSQSRLLALAEESRADREDTLRR